MSPNKKIVLTFILLYIITISSGAAVISYFLNEEGGEIRGEKIERNIFLEPKPKNFVQDPEKDMLIEGGVLIIFVKAGVPEHEIKTSLDLVNGEIVGGCNEKRIFQVYLPQKDLDNTKKALKTLQVEDIFQKVDVNYQVVF